MVSLYLSPKSEEALPTVLGLLLYIATSRYPEEFHNASFFPSSSLRSFVISKFISDGDFRIYFTLGMGVVLIFTLFFSIGILFLSAYFIVSFSCLNLFFRAKFSSSLILASYFLSSSEQLSSMRLLLLL